jgi:hypothetical protein
MVLINLELNPTFKQIFRKTLAAGCLFTHSTLAATPARLIDSFGPLANGTFPDGAVKEDIVAKVFRGDKPEFPAVVDVLDRPQSATLNADTLAGFVVGGS